MPGNRFTAMNKKLHTKCEVIQFIPRSARYAPNARRTVDGLTVIVHRGVEVIARMPIGPSATGAGELPEAHNKHAVLDALNLAAHFICDPDDGDDSAS
jgi:hypothetical protein